MSTKANDKDASPQELPQQAQYQADDTAEAKPEEINIADMGITAETMTDDCPIMTPPGVEEDLAYETGISVWQNSKKVNALWSINQTRNSCASIAGIGWKKLSNKCDSGNVALTILATHAKQTQRNMNFREEADKMIHEIYAW